MTDLTLCNLVLAAFSFKEQSNMCLWRCQKFTCHASKLKEQKKNSEQGNSLTRCLSKRYVYSLNTTFSLAVFSL